MTDLEKTLGYEFKDPALLRQALTHTSYANEQKDACASYERLEFLGDSVLSLIVSDYIYNRFPNLPEGELTKLRASLVCEDALSAYSRKLGVGKYLLLGKGEAQNGGYGRSSILEDVFESVLAAIYIDGGIAPARRHVLRFIEDELKTHHENFTDYKTVLQELVQRNPGEELSYRLVSSSGPDHEKTFTVECLLNSKVIGKGEGGSKKHAEQEAAKHALALMDADSD